MKNFIILLLVTQVTFCQTYFIKYNLNIDMSGNLPKLIARKCTLTTTGNESIFKLYTESKPKKKLDKVIAKDGVTSITYVNFGRDTTYVYKNLIKSEMLSEERIFTKTFDVKDSLDIFNWKIENETLKILDYNCYKATTKFRGKEYEVYFTKEIPIPDGPFKFNGLPGLILKVTVINSESILQLEATSVETNKETTKINHPFGNDKLMTYKEFKDKFKKKYNEINSYNTNQDGYVQIGKTSGLENVIDE